MSTGHVFIKSEGNSCNQSALAWQGGELCRVIDIQIPTSLLKTEQGALSGTGCCSVRHDDGYFVANLREKRRANEEADCDLVDPKNAIRTLVLGNSLSARSDFPIDMKEQLLYIWCGRQGGTLTIIPSITFCRTEPNRFV